MPLRPATVAAERVGSATGMQRVVTAAIGAPLAIAALFVLPRTGLAALIVILCVIAATEFARMGKRSGAGAGVWALPALVLVAILLLAEPALAGSVIGGAVWSAGSRMLALVLMVTFGAALVALATRGPVRERGLTAWVLGFGTLYLALPAAAFDQLRARDPWLIVLMLAVVWLTDIAAFLIGSRWGRHKLAPEVSPNKSWEGAVGGLALGVAAAAVWSFLRLGAVEPWVLAAGALVSIAGQLGDLVESLFKRVAGVKDSGKLLPGHGGMLDRLDSLLVAAPVLELICRFWQLPIG